MEFQQLTPDTEELTSEKDNLFYKLKELQELIFKESSLKKICKK